jgi:phage baseplate assembly protein W
MPQSGFTGISYPFRVNNRGGVSMSTTSATDPTHIAESIRQIFNTSFLERPMESDIYTTVTSLLFEPNDEALQAVLKSRMVDDLERLEERVTCSENDIEFTIEIEDDVEFLYANLTYTIIKYNTSYTSKVKVGEINHE